MIHLVFEAIGTHWQIDLDAPDSQTSSLSKMISDRIAQFDQNYSRFRPDSWVMRVGQKPGRYKVPADFAPMWDLYLQMYKLTGGLVTPLIGDAMNRAGYDANYSLKPGKLKPIPKLTEVLTFDGYTLLVKYDCVLDFGASGKGYLVDLLGDLLAAQGIGFTIDAGGDILHHSPTGQKIRVGLEDPTNAAQVIGVVNLSSALCGSAGNRRKWAGYNHIINPASLTSVTVIAASWVIADTAMLADGLATCLFFVNPNTLTQKFNFDYVIVDDQGRAQYSANLPGELYVK